MWLWVPEAEWAPDDMKPRVIEIGSEPKGPGAVYEVQAKNSIRCNALVRRYLDLEAKGITSEATGETRALLAKTHPALEAVKRVALYKLVKKQELVDLHAPWGQTKKVKRTFIRLVKE